MGRSYLPHPYGYDSRFGAPLVPWAVLMKPRNQRERNEEYKPLRRFKRERTNRKKPQRV